MAQSLRKTTLLPLRLRHCYQKNNPRNHQAKSNQGICRSAVNNLLSLTVLIPFLMYSFMLTQHPRSGLGVAALSCDACDTSLCPDTTACPGGLTLDICGCCQACARTKNQRCGGQFGILGRCDRGLHCFIRPENDQPITGTEEGVCKELQCNGKCPPAYEPQLCPPDSYLATWEMKQDVSKGKHGDRFVHDPSSDNNLFLLTEQTSYCVCNTSACEIPVCASGYSSLLVHNGTDLPGSCCNVYVCRKSEECQAVVCPPYVESLCPEDSVRIPSKWTGDGCCEIQQGCECPSVDLCETVWCPEGFEVQVISRASKLPGFCCDTFRCVEESGLTCIYNGKELRNGETWQIDKCKTCECRDGLNKCKDKACKNLSCTWMIIPEGECCPVCRGCVSDSGNLYNESAVWQENDCTTCTCKDGQAQCQSEMCTVHCTNPKQVPGQCCPVCPDDEPDTVNRMCSGLKHCSIICKQGLEQTPEGCFLCRCKEEKCNLDCQFGLKLNVEGNTMCECKGAEDRCPPWEEQHCDKKCEHGYKHSKDGCSKCLCKKCPQFNCTKRCTHGHILNDEGCPLCKCKETAVPELISSNMEPENIDSRSCMSWHGSRHENGEYWNDGCRLCYCHDGAEMCSLIACPIPHCSNPVFRTGDCCPTCPGHPVISPTRGNEMCESSQGHYYVEGETWKMDLCTHCVCHRGIVLCETPSCPPLVCHHPIKPEGQCCATCRGMDLMSTSSHRHRHYHQCSSETGILYKHDEVWRSTPCQSCVCRDGQIHCYSQVCPPLNCNRTVQRKGHCCPTCVEIGKPKICTYGGVTYDAGEKWQGDNCTQCSCTSGQTKCFPIHCPHLDCTIMIKKMGQCCPECYDHAQLHSHIHDSDNSLLNTTVVSKSISSVRGNIVGITVLGVLVFILVIIVFLLVLYLIRRHPSKFRQRSMSTNHEPQSQLRFIPEQLGKTINLEKQYLEKLCSSVASEKGKGDWTSNEYTEMVFRSQTKDSFKDTNGHFLS